VKIAGAVLHRYSLPLISELTLKYQTLSERRGLLLELVSDSGEEAFGDISPLDGFSHETLEQAEQAGRSLLPRLLRRDIADDIPDNLPASVLFAVETALLRLRAKEQSIEPLRLLNANARDSVSVNGLLTGHRETILDRAVDLVKRGFTTLKLKVGQKPVDDDIYIVKAVRKAIGDSVGLRLDANRGLSIDDFAVFVESVSECNIEYIEEPTDDIRRLLGTQSETAARLPIALDESLLDIQPDDLVFFSSGIRAIVVKPTLLGFNRAHRFCAVANHLGIPATISSAFCSGVGMLPHIRLAASVNDRDIAAGFDTMSWFSQDLLTRPIEMSDGRIHLAHLPSVRASLDRDLLTEVSRA